MAIGHLPTAVVLQKFELLVRRFMNRYLTFRDFLEFVGNTYIRGTFPIPMWNLFDRGHDCRTNNVAEGRL